MTTKTTEALVLGQVLAFSPVPGVAVRLQRVMSAAYAVTVSRTLAVDELRRSYTTEAEARAYARGLCQGLRAGWTIDRLIEVAAVAA